MKKIYLLHAFLIISFFTFLNSCKKEDFVKPPTEVHFTDTIGAYLVPDTNTTEFKIPVGLTQSSNVDQRVTISVSSPSGAVMGSQYTLGDTSIVIKAGQTLEYLTIKGIFGGYPAGRKDTLVFTIINSDAPHEFNSTYTLTMQRYCPVNINDFLGDYANTNEIFGTNPYGPYLTTISSVTPLTATSGTIVVENIFDAGWAPIIFTLDWTDPSNFKATLVQQSGIADAGTISSTYTGKDVSVRPFSGQAGSFSSCDQTLTLKMQLGVTGVGWFASLYTVNLAR